MKKRRVYKILDKFLDIWEKYPKLINILILSIIVLMIVTNNYILYKENNEAHTFRMFRSKFPIGVSNLYNDIQGSLSNIMALGGALITLNGVFLTLLVTLKESEVFKKIKEKFPEIHDYIYLGLKKQLYSCILLMFICIILLWFEDIKWLYLQLIIIGTVGYHLINVSFGAIYNIKNVTDITVKDEPESETAIK